MYLYIRHLSSCRNRLRGKTDSRARPAPHPNAKTAVPGARGPWGAARGGATALFALELGADQVRSLFETESVSMAS